MTSLTAQGIPAVRQLRILAKEKGVQAYRVGGQWETAVWDDDMNVWHTRTEHYDWDGASEREMLARKLGYL